MALLSRVSTRSLLEHAPEPVIVTGEDALDAADVSENSQTTPAAATPAATKRRNSALGLLDKDAASGSEPVMKKNSSGLGMLSKSASALLARSVAPPKRVPSAKAATGAAAADNTQSSFDPIAATFALLTSNVGKLCVYFAIGIAAYQQLEGWSVLDACYFTIVTATTVGYGDVTPATPAGRLFTMAYALLGTTVIVSALSPAVAAVLGGLRSLTLGGTEDKDASYLVRYMRAFVGPIVLLLAGAAYAHTQMHLSLVVRARAHAPKPPKMFGLVTRTTSWACTPIFPPRLLSLPLSLAMLRAGRRLLLSDHDDNDRIRRRGARRRRPQPPRLPLLPAALGHGARGRALGDEQPPGCEKDQGRGHRPQPQSAEQRGGLPRERSGGARARRPGERDACSPRPRSPSLVVAPRAIDCGSAHPR